MDIAVVGAGPVGLTAALRLARLAPGLSVRVLDRRALPADGDRPQLLVARAGDVARLEELGLDVGDRRLVVPLESRHGVDVAAGLAATAQVDADAIDRARPCAVEDLPFQSPIALVPIARLQRALAAAAVAAGVEVVTGIEVGRVRRHARAASISVSGAGAASSIQARLVIVATGAAGAAVEPALARTTRSSPSIRMIAGVFAGGAVGRWSRFELPVQAGVGRVRYTLLETPSSSTAGTALLVDAADRDAATDGQLRRGFERAARYHGIDGSLVVEPRVFDTGAAYLGAVARGGDNRAPVVVAGDAARSGHVFSGLTGLVNVAQAAELSDALAPALPAIAAARFAAPEIGRALDRCQRSASRCAELLARASRSHLSRRREAGWALAGVSESAKRPGFRSSRRSGLVLATF